MSQTITPKQKRDQYFDELKNGNWEGKPAIVVNPFKSQKVLNNTLIGVAVFIVGFFLWNFAGSFFENRVKPSTKAYINDVYKPDMSAMAAQGKTPAILWMAANYPDASTNAQLDALIANNNADAMMLKAQQLYKAQQPTQAYAMVQMAAAQGQPDAIIQTANKPEFAKDATFTALKTIFTDYVFK